MKTSMTPDEYEAPKRRRSPKSKDEATGDMFTAPLHRKTDGEASRDAAERVMPKMNDLRRRVLDAIKRHGPITALEMEELPEFYGMAPTTVRKRCSELVQMGAVQEQGVKDVVLMDKRRTRSTVLVFNRAYGK